MTTRLVTVPRVTTSLVFRSAGACVPVSLDPAGPLDGPIRM